MLKPSSKPLSQEPSNPSNDSSRESKKGFNKTGFNTGLTNEEIESIKQEAMTIMDNFLKALEGSSIDIKLKKDFFVERDLQTRLDYDSKPCDDDFKTLFFKNLPKSNNGFLIAEKKHW